MSTYELENLPVFNSTKAPDQSPLGLSAYSSQDLETWKSWIRKGDLSNITILTLHSVGNDPTPLRWLVNTIQPARLVERLGQEGIDPPSSWRTTAPYTINAWTNSLDSNAPAEHAERLHNLATGYLDLVHPTISKPILETDNEDFVIEVFRHSPNFHEKLPKNIRESLASMASKHRNGLETEPDAPAAYLLSHFNAYGHINIPHGFPERQNALFILPASEHKFFSMMEQVEDAIVKLGLGPISRLIDRNCSVLISDVLRTPHYYPHRGEPTLQTIVNPTDPSTWPSRRNILSGKINGLAKTEIAEALRVIDDDLGGTQNREYHKRLNKVLKLAKETLLSD